MEALLLRLSVDCIMRFDCAVQALNTMDAMEALLVRFDVALFLRCTGAICTLPMR